MNTDSPGTDPHDLIHSLRNSPQLRVLHQSFNRGSKALFTIEPLWVLAFAIFVFSSYLLQWGVVLPWIGLAMAFLPFPLRQIRQGHLKVRTPLDIPVALYLAGALVGLIVSPKFSLSLGAFQCILAATLFYYSWVNYPYLATLMKRLILISIISVITYAIFAYVNWTRLPDSSNPTYHGLALSLVILATIFATVIILRKGTATKVIGGVICLAVFIGVILLVQDSLPSIIFGDSISGRLPFWETTIDMLGDSPFTGLGLGCWALKYHGSEIITHPTNVHNAYLDIYSNTGLLGIIALGIALIIGVKLAWNIIKSPRNHPWHGFGVGVVFAFFITLLVGIVESSPVGIPLEKPDTYHYFISPAPWILGGLLVTAHRLLCKNKP